MEETTETFDFSAAPAPSPVPEEVVAAPAPVSEPVAVVEEVAAAPAPVSETVVAAPVSVRPTFLPGVPTPPSASKPFKLRFGLRNKF
jgi:hypothetical protein